MLMNKVNGTQSNETNDQVLDLWGVFVRHWRVIVTSLVLTTGLGALYYITAEPTYRSTASILIETKTNPSFDNGGAEDRPTEIRNVETHAFTIKSRMIVMQAFKDHGLGQLETLRELDSDVDPIQFVMDNLVAQVAEDDTTAIALSYDGKSAGDCEAVVSAVTKTYEDYLGAKIQAISAKTSDLIVKAKDELLAQIQTKETAYHEFQRNAPLMWKSGEGINIHRERQTELEQERSARLIERAKLVAKIEAVEMALARGSESREAIYFEAVSALRPKNDDEEFIVEREAARGYSVELSREYVDLVMKVKEMSERFGEGHPDLLSLKNRADAMRAMIDQSLGKDGVEGDPKLGPAVDPFTKDVDYVEVYRHSLRDSLNAVDTELRELNDAYENEQDRANEMQIYMAADQMKRSDIERLTKLFDAVVARLEEITLIRDYGGDTMRVLESARLGEQVAPSPWIVLLMSLVTGTLLGSLLAIILDFTETTFRSPTEVRNALQAPVIGRIPKMRKQRTRSEEHTNIDPIVCTAHRQGSTDAEAYRAIRTALFFGGSKFQQRVIQITSPMPGDGKSTLISNLAVTIARSGKRVVILDADFRKPVIHSLFGIDNTNPGLSGVVAGDVAIEEVTNTTSIPGLDIVAAGQPPQNPSELLSSDNFTNVIDGLREQYDFVLIDTPPLLAVTDPSIVSARVDGVIMAIRIYKGIRVSSKRSKEILESMDARLIGIVVNGIQDKAKGGYGRYGFGYGYGYGFGVSYGYGEMDAEQPTETVANLSHGKAPRPHQKPKHQETISV